MTVRIRSVVIRLPVAGPVPELLYLAADIARLIGADLRALYVEDGALFDVADLPLAREVDPLRPSGERWRPLARAQLQRDFDVTAAALQRRLREIARAVGVPVEFSVVRAGVQLPSALDELRAHGDFVLVVPAERAAELPSLPAGAVLYAPTTVTHRGGDVIALADRADAPAVRLADRIARAAHARLLVIAAAGDADDLQQAIGRVRARLIVAAADVFAYADDAARLAALRRAPVIVVPGSAND